MADLKPISAFNAASAVDANTLFLVSTPNGANYDSENASAALVADAVVNDFEYTQDLSTVSKKVTGGINENKSVIGYSYDEYDPTTAYSTGDLCIYNNTLYKAKQATTGNLPTNTTYWEQTSIADAINELKSGKQDTLTVQTGTISSETGTTIARQILLKFGNVVFLTCDIKVANVVRWSTFATLPSGFRPTGNVYTVAINTGSSAGAQNAHVQISSGGNMAFGNSLPDANVQYSISMAWIVN